MHAKSENKSVSETHQMDIEHLSVQNKHSQQTWTNKSEQANLNKRIWETGAVARVQLAFLDLQGAAGDGWMRLFEWKIRQLALAYFAVAHYIIACCNLQRRNIRPTATMLGTEQTNWASGTTEQTNLNKRIWANLQKLSKQETNKLHASLLLLLILATWNQTRQQNKNPSPSLARSLPFPLDRSASHFSALSSTSSDTKAPAKRANSCGKVFFIARSGRAANCAQKEK